MMFLMGLQVSVQRDGFGDTQVVRTDAFGDREVVRTDAFGDREVYIPSMKLLNWLRSGCIKRAFFEEKMSQCRFLILAFFSSDGNPPSLGTP